MKEWIKRIITIALIHISVILSVAFVGSKSDLNYEDILYSIFNWLIVLVACGFYRANYYAFKTYKGSIYLSIGTTVILSVIWWFISLSLLMNVINLLTH
jgi:hypothetical protein